MKVEESGPTAAARLWLLLRRFWVPALLVLIGLCGSSTVTLLHSEAMSPLDEWVYLDYLYKVPTDGFVHRGDPVGHDALEMMACEGVTPYGTMGAACGADYDYRTFPFGGLSSADPYTPVFFWLTRVTGDAISFVTGVDQVVGWRLTGSLWLAGGLIVFSALLRRWGVRPLVIFALGLAFIGSPLAYWSYSYVSTDAPSFLAGGSLLLIATHLIRRSSHPAWFVIVAVVAGLLKITNLLGVGMVALFLMVQGLVFILGREQVRRGWRLIFTALGAVVAAIGGQVVWLAINRATPVSSELPVQGVESPLTIQELLNQFVNLLPNTLSFNVPVAGGSGFVYPLPGFAGAPLAWLCIAGVIGAVMLLRSPWTRRSSVVVAVAVSSLIAAPVLAVTLQLVMGGYFSLPSRYGASLLPGFLLLAGMLMRNRVVPWLVICYAGALILAQLYGAYLLGRG